MERDHKTAFNTVHGNCSSNINVRRKRKQNACIADAKKQNPIQTKTQKEKEATIGPESVD